MAKANDTCNYPDCTNLVGKHGAKGYCSKHYERTRPPCSIEGCGRPARSSRGLCRYHHRLDGPRCSVEGCEKPRIALGYCSMHRRRVKVNGEPGDPSPEFIVYPKDAVCAFEGCERPRQTREWCKSHYSQWARTGEVKPLSFTLDRQVTSFQCASCGVEVSAFTRRNGQQHRTDTTYCEICATTSPDGRRLRRYGITPDQYAAALERGCEICGDHPDLLHIDHDHSCCAYDALTCCGNCNRGFLCANCNTALGLLQDNPDVAANAAKYLATNARV